MTNTKDNLKNPLNDTLISVVMATYNGQNFLSAQLTSIINQTYSNIEIIICDDCSTDNTRNIIEDFAKKDNRIHYVFNEKNIGYNKNFEQGIVKAKGDFIAIADQDDIWKEEKLEVLMELFTSENVALVHGASVVFSNDNIPSQKAFNNTTIPFAGNDSRALLIRNSISGHNMIFRRQVIEKAIPFPEALFYDWWIAVYATCVGNIVATNKILAFQRKHENNVTVKKKRTKKQTIAECEERIIALKKFISIPNLPEKSSLLANQLLKKYQGLANKKFSFGLFYLLLKNAPILFAYKKNRVPLVSYLKVAYRMSFAVKD